jgi:carboxyl-terminal processing protease
VRSRLLLALLVPALLLTGIWLGGHPDTLPGPIRDGLVGDEDARLVQEALDEVGERYYRKIGDEELVDRSIAGLVKSLDDPFSAYFTPQQYEKFRQVQNSQFSGVGMTVSQHPRGLRVVETFEGSPARRAGIRRGAGAGGSPSRPGRGRSRRTARGARRRAARPAS